METQKKLLTLGAGMASMAAVLGGSLLMNGNSGANAASDTNTAYAASVTVAQHANDRDRAAYITALAAKLGISETQLTDALKSVQLDQIAKAVTAGTMTQAQADEMTARINSGDAPMFGLGGPGHDDGKRGGPKFGHVDDAALATFLGVDEATLETALHGGKSLTTVASENGKSRDQLKAFLTTQLKAELAKGVADGKLTQAQADARLAEATTNLDARIDQVGGEGGPRGGGHGMGRHGSRNGSAPANPSSPAKPGA